jgi:ferredoxin
MAKTASPKSKRYRLSSFNLTKPGLLTLLFRRSFIVGMSDFTFHIGLFGSIITGGIMEFSNLAPWFAAFFNGYGWLISWSHGVTGVFLVIGGAGFVARYVRNRYFRLAYGKTFYLDLAFMVTIAVTGTLQALAVFGLLPVVGFTPYPFEWAASIHVTMIYAWAVLSLFLGGAAKQAVAAVAWRLTSPANKHATFLTFSDACGRCGRCAEVCPLYEATGGADVEAPVLKLRKYFRMVAKGSLPASEVKSIAEQTTVCTLCGLCAGVCPFSFNFVDMYKWLLAYANRLYPLSPLGQSIAPQSV